MHKIFFFAKGSRQLASSRLGAYLIADYLREKGYDAQVFHLRTRPWWDLSFARWAELWRNAHLLASLSTCDVLYLQKAIYQVDFLVLVLLRQWLFGGRYVFSFDDAIYLEKKGHNAFKTSLMIRNAMLVIVPNDFLRDYALQYNKNTHIIPVLIDTEHLYVPARRRTGGPAIRLGWTGTLVHYDNLKMLVEPLRRLVTEGYPIEFVQLGGDDPTHKINRLLSSVEGLKVTFIPTEGDPRQTIPVIQQFDIGLTPLQKTEWNRGKNTLKTKEYMACGVPVVASAWGENTTLITNGVNGLLADTGDEWYRALKHLITDPEYRGKISNGGRALVERTCSYKVYIPKLLELFDACYTRAIWK